MRGNFDDQESIMAVSDGLGGLLRASATPANGLRHRMMFRRLGNSPSDPAVAAVHVADELQTCFNVQDALPHDKTME